MYNIIPSAPWKYVDFSRRNALNSDNKKISFPDGRKYDGAFRLFRGRPIPHGEGKMTYPIGQGYDYIRYVGSWKNGKWDGRGTLTCRGGQAYIGDFEDGQPIFGMCFEDQNLYNGNFRKGLKHGSGRAWDNNSSYDRQWENGNLVSKVRNIKSNSFGHFKP